MTDEALIERMDAATPEQIDRATAAVEANLIDGVPRYESAQGYACALTAIIQSDAALASSDRADLVRRVDELKHDVERQMKIANAECNRAEGLKAERDALRKALKLAVPIIEQEREEMVKCSTILHRGSPDYGKVTDPDVVEWLAAADAALDAVRAALHSSNTGGE